MNRDPETKEKVEKVMKAMEWIGRTVYRYKNNICKFKWNGVYYKQEMIFGRNWCKL
jgi:hypothetical protein